MYQRSHVRPSPVFFGILAVTVAGGAVLALADPFTISDEGFFERTPLGILGMILLILGGWALSLTLHEFGHAYIAFRGGDRSVAAKGYLTMDVRHYTDPVLSIVLPLLLLVIGGIPLPGGAVWINQGALRSRGVATAVSLAGPLSNLAIGVVLTLAVVLFPGMPVGLAIGILFLAWLQILAFVLNILPVPGLDGYGAIEPYLSPQARELGHKARPWAPLVLFAVLILLEPVRSFLFFFANGLFLLLGGDLGAVADGFSLFQFWQ